MLQAIERQLHVTIGPDRPGAALAISHGGTTILSTTAGLADVGESRQITPQSRFDAGSVIKTLTGLAIAALESEGALSVEAPVRSFFPELPEYTDGVMLKNLLHHESGLRNYTVLLYYMAGWHEMAPPSPDVVFDTICQSGSLSFSPGERYEYCDTNYFLLARVVEAVTGQRFGDFVRDRFMKPLGMNDSEIVDDLSVDRSTWAEGYLGYPSELRSPYLYRTPGRSDSFHPTQLQYTHVGAEGLRTTAEDLMALGQAMAGISPGLPDGIRHRVLTAPRTREDGFGYGYGVNVGAFRGMRFFGHSGEIQGFTATLTCFPDEELIISCLTNRQDIGAWTLRNRVLDTVLGDGTLDFPPRLAPDLKAETVEAVDILGFYLEPMSARFAEISQADGKLTLSLNGGVGQPLLGDGPWKTSDGIDVIQRPSDGGVGRPSLIIQQRYVASRFLPFVAPDEAVDWHAIEGRYTCVALRTSFDVAVHGSGLRLTNVDASRPSMDLDYEPTIRDFFWSRDPHPGISQIQFLRNSATEPSAFVYRDFDGDRREVFQFVAS